jgi:hypothetical protein
MNRRLVEGSKRRFVRGLRGAEPGQLPELGRVAPENRRDKLAAVLESNWLSKNETADNFKLRP